ncbi:AaceriAFR359Cp [[Ashbya] aceris (nom. inval.)]|nr:AaceriAFR359Cp [[Ashbya] aceris (nom. inval.)]
MGDYDAFILDVEGTVCPIAFVREQLFPYFLDKVDELVGNADETERALIADMQSRHDGADTAALLRRLVAEDVKDPALKALQGRVWERGYASGEIKAPVYADAVRFIQRNAGRVYIYSSGSVQAQRLLFGHVTDPLGDGVLDLTGHLAGFFDIPAAGRKTEASSYQRILAAIGFEQQPGAAMFVSDSVAELDAASASGLSVRLAVRPGNERVSEAQYSTVTDFEDL